MSTVLGLVPSAQTPWSCEDLIEGETPLPPTREGLDCLSSLAAHLQQHAFQSIYAWSGDPSRSSSLMLAERLNLPVAEWQELRPLKMGSWTGLRRGEVEDRFGRMYRRWRAEPQTIAPPCGETLWEAAARVGPVVERILNGKRSIVVTAAREILIALQMALVLKTSDVAANRLFMPSGSETTSPWALDIPKEGFKVIRLNETDINP